MTAPRRKGWDALSPALRKRYVSSARRLGIPDARAYYDSGQSLSALRGHAATPERPTLADSRDRQYARYRRARNPKGMLSVTTDGVIPLWGLSKRDRTLVGRHSNATKAGDAAQLAKFRGRTVTGFAEGSETEQTFTLQTNPEAIARLHYVGELDYPSIYAETAA